jgi:uncharacterized protein YdeI (YjbR/CyaY-like superfamily)
MEDPTFFPTPADFQKWLAENHEQEQVLWVGYYKKASKIPSITWPESVEEALCYGWIDGLRKTVDDVSYKIRFTPRRPTSFWSAVNIDLMEKLQAEGRMQPAGLAAWERRKENKSKIYAYEQEAKELPPAYSQPLQANPKAWEFFENLAPGYKKNTIHWVMSAKREETRQRRLESLIESCEAGLLVPPFRR